MIYIFSDISLLSARKGKLLFPGEYIYCIYVLLWPIDLVETMYPFLSFPKLSGCFVSKWRRRGSSPTAWVISLTRSLEDTSASLLGTMQTLQVNQTAFLPTSTNSPVWQPAPSPCSSHPQARSWRAPPASPAGPSTSSWPLSWR